MMLKEAERSRSEGQDKIARNDIQSYETLSMRG